MTSHPFLDDAARIIMPDQLIGSKTVCTLLDIDRSTLSRRISKGQLKPLAQLDGPKGAYVFDAADIAATTTRRKLA